MAAGPPLTLFKKLEFLVARPPIKAEIGIESQDSRFLKDLSTSNQACIGQRNWPVGVFAKKKLDVRPVIFSRQRDLVDTLAAKANYLCWPRRVHFLHEEACFSDYGFAATKRRRGLGEQAFGAAVKRIIF